MEQHKPRIDYSDVFDEDVGQEDGMWVWQIENFYPTILDPSFHGHFYEADAYLILRTTKVSFLVHLGTERSFTLL